MITIQGVKRPIRIPSSWEELTPVQYIFTVSKLLELMGGHISLPDFRMALLLCYTGYRPRYSRILPDNPARRAVINENILRLSETIRFPFKETDPVEISNRFSKNPLPFIRIGRRKYTGKRFDTGIIIHTDITAREFSDAIDTTRAFAETQSEECLNTLCAILYPALPGHKQNLLSGHSGRFRKLPYETRYAILVWFTGIVEFFSTHPDYGILFRNDSGSNDKITLGMSETIMHLSLTGFGSLAEMEQVSVVEYFDLQIKSVKKMIADARSAGAKIEDIANQAKMPYSLIEKLS